MWYKITSKPKIIGTTLKFWPKSKKIPLISEKTQANPKKTQGIWLKTQCTRGKSLLHPLKKRENKKPGVTCPFQNPLFYKYEHQIIACWVL